MRAAADPSRLADAMRSAMASGADFRTPAGQQRLRALQKRLRSEGIALVEERLSLLEKEGASMPHGRGARSKPRPGCVICSATPPRQVAGMLKPQSVRCSPLDASR